MNMLYNKSISEALLLMGWFSSMELPLLNLKEINKEDG